MRDFESRHCQLHKFCDEHLFEQVNTSTDGNQLPVFRCTNVHLRRNSRPLFRRAVLYDVMSQSELTTMAVFFYRCARRCMLDRTTSAATWRNSTPTSAATSSPICLSLLKLSSTSACPMAVKILLLCYKTSLPTVEFCRIHKSLKRRLFPNNCY